MYDPLHVHINWVWLTNNRKLLYCKVLQHLSFELVYI